VAHDDRHQHQELRGFLRDGGDQQRVRGPSHNRLANGSEQDQCRRRAGERGERREHAGEARGRDQARGDRAGAERGEHQADGQHRPERHQNGSQSFAERQRRRRRADRGSKRNSLGAHPRNYGGGEQDDEHGDDAQEGPRWRHASGARDAFGARGRIGLDPGRLADLRGRFLDVKRTALESDDHGDEGVAYAADQVIEQGRRDREYPGHDPELAVEQPGDRHEQGGPGPADHRALQVRIALLHLVERGLELRHVVLDERAEQISVQRLGRWRLLGDLGGLSDRW
jgi:hypothetical protein